MGRFDRPGAGLPARGRKGQSAGQARPPGQACGNLTKTLSSQYPTSQIKYLILRNFSLQPRKACPISVASDDASQPFASQQTPRSQQASIYCKPARSPASTPALTPAFRQPVRLPACRQPRRASRRQHRRRVASGPRNSRQARDPWQRQAVRQAHAPLPLRHPNLMAGPALQPQASCAVAIHAQRVGPLAPRPAAQPCAAPPARTRRYESAGPGSPPGPAHDSTMLQRRCRRAGPAAGPTVARARGSRACRRGSRQRRRPPPPSARRGARPCCSRCPTCAGCKRSNTCGP